MYSILMSNLDTGFEHIKNQISNLINKNTKITVIPWSFAVELKSKNINEFFDEKKIKKYINPFLELGLDKNNITILDCYNDSTEYMIDKINQSSILILTGGNPEMFYNKVIETGIIDCLKNYNNTIIGVSAGAELQLKKYFITKKNNYYNKFDWYEGFGIINNDFYFDVHSINKGRYIPSLREKSIKLKKNIYCLFDSGVIIYNRKNEKIETYGEVIVLDQY